VSACRRYVSIRDAVLGTDPTDEELSSLISPEKLPRSRFVKGRYLSPWSKQTEKGFMAAMKWLATRRQNKLNFPESISGDQVQLLASPQSKIDKAKLADKSRAHVTWIGHATVYAQVGGLSFLTDPMFSDYAAPVQIMGPRRFVPPGIEAEELDVDCVLLSHTHYDHLDYDSAMRIANNTRNKSFKPQGPLWLVPLGVKAVLQGWGITNVEEMDWWSSKTLAAPSGGGEVTVSFVPAKHWTSRTPFDRNTCLWGGFTVTAPACRFYFAGDTAYDETVFKQIGSKYGPFDIGAIPIGAYKPRDFMKDHHCDPSEALDIHNDVRSKQSLAIHWGTFPLADEDFTEPALELARARDAHPERLAEGTSFFTMTHGDTHVVGDQPPQDFSERHPLLYSHYLKHYGKVSARQR